MKLVPSFTCHSVSSLSSVSFFPQGHTNTTTKRQTKQPAKNHLPTTGFGSRHTTECRFVIRCHSWLMVQVYQYMTYHRMPVCYSMSFLMYDNCFISKWLTTECRLVMSCHSCFLIQLQQFLLFNRMPVGHSLSIYIGTRHDCRFVIHQHS